MLKAFYKAKNLLLDVLLPKFCVGCGKEGNYICKDCEIFLSEVYPDPSQAIMSVWEYEGLMKKLIHRIKVDGCYDIIGELIKKALMKVGLDLPEDAVITYVPMHAAKERQRGFNQSELIAKELGKVLGRKAIPLLEKIKDNSSQAELPLDLRLSNVENVFSFKGSFVPEKVLLIDDYCVSGATLNKCSKVMRDRGVKDVWAFVLACQLRV